MPEITDEQMFEYEKLKKWAIKERVFKSANEITKLEDDIDNPIKNCVGMFALLGIQPLYSCCGFDYDGQPFHKSHQYGRPYVILADGQRTDEFLRILSTQKTIWYAERGSEGCVNLQVMVGMNPYWRKEECIHFAEECVIACALLERLLWRFRGSMVNEIVLEDTNARTKKDLEHWRYPPKEPWVIRISDIEKSITKK